MNNLNIKGLSMTEMLVSVSILGVLMLATAEFASTTLKTSYRHTQQVMGIKESRSISERIEQRLDSAEYILPSGKSMSLCTNYSTGTTSGCITVSSDDSLAMLIPSLDNISKYNIVVFYMYTNSDSVTSLYEFVSDAAITWTKGTVPTSNFYTVYGNNSAIASNVIQGESPLTLYLADVDSPSDPLYGTGKRSTEDSDALINRVYWPIVFTKNNINTSVTINGVPKNVPRFL